MKPPVTGPEKDDNCPYFQKPLRSVCHRCHFYQHIRGKSAIKRFEGDTGEWLDFWGCALAAQFAMMSGVAKSADEQTEEMNVLRNKMLEINEQNKELLSQIGKAMAESQQAQMMLGAQVARTVSMLVQQIERANKLREDAVEYRQMPVISEMSQ